MKPVKKQRWTNIDAFGLLNGISTWDKNYLNLKYVRLPNETNIELRDKINRNRENPVTGTSLQDLVNGLSNELLLDPYNVISNSSFVLSRNPWPSGYLSEQDIWLSYQTPGETGWYDVYPQLWASGCITTPTSGFIVWENSFFRDDLGTSLKSHNYSNLLTVFDDIPDNSKLRLIYYVQSFDIENNQKYNLYTDMANTLDDDLVYKLPYALTSGDLPDKIVAYNIDNIPTGLSGFYHEEGGEATSNLYKIRGIIDRNYRHRWKDIRNKSTIWDVHKEYSKGTIPSFYDTHLTINSSGNINLTGGVEYQDSALYIQNVDVQISGDYEYWYPVLTCGKLYCSGIPYLLMENPAYESVIFSTGSGTLPSGVERWHRISLIESTYSGNYMEKNIIPLHNYNIPYKTNYSLDISGYVISDYVYRKRPYISSEMGYEITLADKEYMIDFSNYVIYSSGINNAMLFWDNSDIPSGWICTDSNADMNPLNDNNIAYDKYFMVLRNSVAIQAPTITHSAVSLNFQSGTHAIAVDVLVNHSTINIQFVANTATVTLE